MDIDLKNINVSDIKEKLKAIDKKTLIKFGIGFGAIVIFLIGYYAILNPIVKKKKALFANKILKQNEIIEFDIPLNCLIVQQYGIRSKSRS